MFLMGCVLRLCMRLKRSERRRSIPTRSGLSLLDLVLAVLILGILAAVAAPRATRTWSRLKVDSAAQRLTAKLNAARRLASTRNKPLRLTFTATPPGYELRELATNTLVTAYASASDVTGATLTANFNSLTRVDLNVFGQPASSGSLQLTAGNYTRTITSNSQSQGAFVLQ